ncbi:MAG: UvrD-helicase domain-containing protein [Actinomycetota bacterium]
MFERESERWRDGLNEAQLVAVLHDGPPVLAVAGAGTGKTRTLVARLARLLEQGAAPERTLLLTFSRRASKEMLGRAQRLAGGPEATRVWGGTFHAMANRLLRRYGQALGLPSSFTIMDSSDARPHGSRPQRAGHGGHTSALSSKADTSTDLFGGGQLSDQPHRGGGETLSLVPGGDLRCALGVRGLL